MGYYDVMREKLLADYEAFSSFDSKNQPEESKANSEQVPNENVGEYQLDSDDSEIPY